MTAQIAEPSPFDSEQYWQDLALKNARLGLLLWRITNGLVFVFFIFANYLMRNAQPSWPPPGVAPVDSGIPLLISAALLLSAVTASRVLAAIRRDDRLSAQRHIAATMGLGAIFLIGVLAVIAQIPYSGSYSSIIVMMNGFHALHVAVGLGLFGYVLLKVGRGAYTKERHWGAEATVIFWHFVDLMWIFFFLVIYVV
jgi:cytochrome c oxidase subunit 3